MLKKLERSQSYILHEQALVFSKDARELKENNQLLQSQELYILAFKFEYKSYLLLQQENLNKKIQVVRLYSVASLAYICKLYNIALLFFLDLTKEQPPDDLLYIWNEIPVTIKELKARLGIDN